MNETAQAQEITITRVFDAPRRLVWEAWTDPGQLAAWWGAHGWKADPARLTMDVRPGGVFSLTSVDEDGREMPQEGVYREVLEPERLVIEEPAQGNWHEGSEIVVTFADLGGDRTEVVLRGTINTTEEMARTAEGGINETLERLGKHLEAR